MLCRRLDGIPLAIELAAARVRSMLPDDLVTRLDQRSSCSRGEPSHARTSHRPSRSTIDWSYDLLEPIERKGPGPSCPCLRAACDLAAAGGVLADEGSTCQMWSTSWGRSIDKSLVVAEDVEDRGTACATGLLESIRQYAAERLEARGETAAVRRRHADHFVALAEAAGPHLRSRDQIEWVADAPRPDNFRAALDWAIESPSPDHAIRLVSRRSDDWRSHRRRRGRVGRGGDRDPRGGCSAPLYSFVVAWAALGAVLAADYDRAEALVARAASAPASDMSELSLLSSRRPGAVPWKPRGGRGPCPATDDLGVVARAILMRSCMPSSCSPARSRSTSRPGLPRSKS